MDPAKIKSARRMIEDAMRHVGEAEMFARRVQNDTSGNADRAWRAAEQAKRILSSAESKLKKAEREG